MTDYPLTYHHRVTGKKMLGKFLTANDAKLFDPETGEVSFMSKWNLNKEYAGNNKNRGQSYRFPRKQKRMPAGKAFNDYLNGKDA